MSNEIESEQDQNPNLVKQLRETIERLQVERDQYKGQVRDTVLGDTFKQYGLDPSTGAGKLAAQAYEGDLSPDAVQSWLDEQGFEARAESDDQQAQPQPDGLAQRVQQRQNLDRIANDSAPAQAGQKMTVAEHQQLMKTDPQAGLKAAREGRIEFSSPDAAAALNQSRNSPLGV